MQRCKAFGNAPQILRCKEAKLALDGSIVLSTSVSDWREVGEPGVRPQNANGVKSSHSEENPPHFNLLVGSNDFSFG